VGKTLPIRVAVSPADAGLKWTLTGDTGGELVQLNAGEFQYKRGEDPNHEVTIRFELVSDPAVWAELHVIGPSHPKETTSNQGPLPEQSKDAATDDVANDSAEEGSG
jgi:hypothetical protein